MKITNDIKIITNILKNDGCVLMQTDTIFGLICNGLSDKAIKKVEIIKRRNKPSFGFFVKNIDIAKQYANINDIQEKCFNIVFPGYFTLILEANERSIKTIPNRALGDINGMKTIGIRVPKNNFCLKLLDNFDFPLVATSANISGQQPSKTFETIEQSIIKSVDAIYYDDKIKIVGLNSTIINIIDINKAKIIRKGSGDIKILENIITIK